MAADRISALHEYPAAPSARERPFSYTCSACSRCCHEKVIRVNPYEAARLASFLGVTTSAFLRSYTWGGGTILRMPYHGNCIFRNTHGCSVHEARPLVCRLYPLRRLTLDDGSEDFELLDFEYRCTALAGNTGTIGGYLRDQKAEPYLVMADGYAALTDIMTDSLLKHIDRTPALAQEAARLLVSPAVNDQRPLPPWLDMDSIVEEYCSRTGQMVPRGTEEKALVHMTALREWFPLGPEGDDNPMWAHLPSSRDFEEEAASAIRMPARTLALLGYMVGVNIEELGRERFGLSNREMSGS